ncbi:hypothetical protein SOVF_129520 [Spinacia oleracea]|uniref:non-specific serine/threonine protein kinase n=1 Tax=Spinacia oleracea TaxID=3562 RepID=A0A9R0J1M3_SPIOL|nr:putative serine/threonine-protein kinase-like protein CCR3 [Spinacia oleracea]KNA12038.1 hypothetical protein SOVF_129520 [Spinacia oleracea]
MKKKASCFSPLERCQFFLVLLTLFFFITMVSGFGSSSTIAASHGSNTVCGILAGKYQGIQCFQQGKTFSVLPNISYEAISGGQDFFCGLSSGGFDLFCWDTIFPSFNFHGKRIYHNTRFPLTDLTVGDDQVCAVQARTGNIRCWEREARLGLLTPTLPRVEETAFLALTSGKGFSCGIVKDERNVLCWGESGIGDFIEREFGNMSMLSLVAGKSHVCGIAFSGLLICKGINDSGQLNVPLERPFHFSELALGRTYSCALQRSNGSLICWGNRGNINTSVITTDQKVQNLSFQSIISGVDYICGLRTDDFTVICWGPGLSGKLNTSVSLPSMVPGRCVRESCQLCGVLPDSESLCSGDTVICRSCVIELPLPLKPKIKLEAGNVPEPIPSPTAISPSSYPISSPPSKKETLRPLWAYEVFGFVGILSGMFAFAYFIYLKRPGSSKDGKKVLDVARDKQHDSVGSSNTGDSAFIASNASSAPQSRSSSITQLSSMTLGRARSWDYSSKHVEKSEVFTLFELAAATKNFSLENRIGRGSFGTVYKGKLSNIGCEVAIKREEICTRKERGNAFESELVLLTRVHHKHLVSLVGFCEEQNERLLVYEYMSNGALHDHLHTKNTHKSNGSVNSWKIRINIALDAARGIEYLHNYAVPPIIHRDIKSSNILLDANWVGRVSDFGLSLKGPENQEGSMSIKPVGTVGYIDPEYYVLKVLTTKSDVYGFGVVLLELLTGKKAVFKEGEKSGPTGVVEYAGPFIVSGEVWKVLDKRVEIPVMNESEAVELLAYTAMMCVNLEGKERPTMSDVVSNLERALTLCKGSSGTFSPPNFYSFS